MKKLLIRRLPFLLILLVLITQVSVYAAAGENQVNNSSDGKLINILQTEKSIEKIDKKHVEQVKDQKYETIEVTDAKEIEKLAKIHGFTNTSKEKITKIELVNVTPVAEIVNPLEEGISLNHLDWTIRAVKSGTCVDYGSGWYNSSTDLKWDLWWDGPDTAVVQETISEDASYNCSVGVSASEVTAEVGFSVSSSYSVMYSSTTPVPADKKLNVKVYRLHQKKSFDVWEYHLFNAAHYYTTGWAYKPNGAYFAKAWYDL